MDWTTIEVTPEEYIRIKEEDHKLQARYVFYLGSTRSGKQIIAKNYLKNVLSLAKVNIPDFDKYKMPIEIIVKETNKKGG